jgi:hypothetical protein
MSRSPTGHGFWMPASNAGDTRPGVLATTLCSERTSGLRVPRRRELELHENVLLGRRDILMVSARCAEAPVLFAKQLRGYAVTPISETRTKWRCFGAP